MTVKNGDGTIGTSSSERKKKEKKECCYVFPRGGELQSETGWGAGGQCSGKKKVAALAQRKGGRNSRFQPDFWDEGWGVRVTIFAIV